MKSGGTREFEYDIALSFASEDREVAKDLATRLKQGGISVFYDADEEANLWGDNLFVRLAEVYADKARFCVILISTNYAKKEWTRHELRSAFERMLQQDVYILPLKLDDTRLPGLPTTIHHVDMRKKSVDEIVDLIKEKLRGLRTGPSARVRTKEVKSAAQFQDIPMPLVRQEITDRAKDTYLSSAFEVIKNYFEEAITRLERHGREIEAQIIHVNNVKFVCKVYRAGTLAASCKIWIGRPSSTESICFSEGNFDYNNDSSMNEWITANDDGSDIYLEMHVAMFGDYPHVGKLRPEEVAENLWMR